MHKNQTQQQPTVMALAIATAFSSAIHGVEAARAALATVQQKGREILPIIITGGHFSPQPLEIALADFGNKVAGLTVLGNLLEQFEPALTSEQLTDLIAKYTKQAVEDGTLRGETVEMFKKKVVDLGFAGAVKYFMGAPLSEVKVKIGEITKLIDSVAKADIAVSGVHAATEAGAENHSTLTTAMHSIGDAWGRFYAISQVVAKVMDAAAVMKAQETVRQAA